MKGSGCPDERHCLPFSWAARGQDSIHSFTRTMDLERGGPSKEEMLNKQHIYFISHSLLFSPYPVDWDASEPNFSLMVQISQEGMCRETG